MYIYYGGYPLHCQTSVRISRLRLHDIPYSLDIISQAHIENKSQNSDSHMIITYLPNCQEIFAKKL